jgi:hypothetical protein
MSLPFNLPIDLKQWNYETVYQLVSEEAYEQGIFDFKDTLKARGSEEGENEHSKNMRKVIGSMANTLTGGFIIFGILDRSRHPNKTIEERIVGIEDGDLRKEFDDKQKESIHPHVYFETCPKLIKIPHVQGKGIFVVRIPPSPKRPHMVTTDNVNVFYRRGDGGTAIPMSYYEVRDQMLYSEGRLQKVRLFRLKIVQFKKQNQILLDELGLHKTINVFLRFDTGTFETLLADICDLMPAETDLLGKLLDITTTVNLINGIINRASLRSIQPQQSPDVYIERISEEYPQNLNKLTQQLEECEKQLSEIFDSLD